MICLILELNSTPQTGKLWGNYVSTFLTPSQQTETPEASTAVAEGWKQQRIEVERLHQEPEKIGHYTVVTENHRGLTGKLDKNRKDKRDSELQGRISRRGADI